MNPTVLAKARNVRLMGFDVDGVLTDGTLWFSAQGDELKGFNTLDGHGLKMLAESGVTLALITGRRSRAVELRAANLGIQLLLQGVEDKRSAMQGLLEAHGLSFAEATLLICPYCAPVAFLPAYRMATLSCSTMSITSRKPKADAVRRVKSAN